jgi:hypothetical protein
MTAAAATAAATATTTAGRVKSFSNAPQRRKINAVWGHAQVHSFGLRPGATISEAEVDEGLRIEVQVRLDVPNSCGPGADKRQTSSGIGCALEFD